MSNLFFDNAFIESQKGKSYALITNTIKLNIINKKMINMTLTNKQVIYLLAILSTVFILSACTPKTEAEKIEKRLAEINQQIAPDGYLTKTHLYINWPAINESGKELAKPLKLKIPIEYLVPPVTFKEKTAIEYAMAGPIFMQSHQITLLSIRMLHDANPYVPITPTKYDPPEERRRKNEYFNNSYSVSISRHNLFKVPNYHSELYFFDRRYGDLVRESDISGLERYVRAECYEIDRMKEEINTGVRDPKTLQTAFDYIATKASDDHSPENCYEDRGAQYFLLPPETSLEKAIFISCGEGISCDANFGLQNHEVTLVVSKENSIIEYKRRIIETRGPSLPFKPFPQPLVGAVWTDIPFWRNKVDPTRELINTFVLPDDSPEIQQIFGKQ